MKVISINVGQKRIQENKGRAEITGIYKLPVSGPVRITTLGIAEDFIGSPKHHGGPDQSLYVFGEADYQWWQTELGRGLEAGTFGENLTISELESAEFNIGDVLHIGDVTLQVTAPRIPCGTFASRMGEGQWVKKFRDAERPGFYVRVLREGMFISGEEVRVERYAGQTLSLIEVYRAYYDKQKGEEVIRRHLAAPIAIRLRERLEEDLRNMQIQ